MSLNTVNAFDTIQTGEPLNDADEQPSSGADLETALNLALESQRYLIAVWYIADGRIHLVRELFDFPHADLPLAQKLLHSDLEAVHVRP